MDLSAVETLNSLLYSVHLGLSTALAAPEVMLSKEESEKLATAAARVSRHYDILPSEKTMDWGHLFIALGSIYIPRVIVHNQRVSATRIAEAHTHTYKEAA